MMLGGKYFYSIFLLRFFKSLLPLVSYLVFHFFRLKTPLLETFLMTRYDSSPTKAKDFEGEGGPETKKQIYEEEHGGNDDVRGNIRQGTETRRP